MSWIVSEKDKDSQLAKSLSQINGDEKPDMQSGS